MLRSWRDRLLIGLAPAELTLARVTGGLRPKIVSRGALPCDPGFGTEPWQGAAATLAGVAEKARGERLEVTVVLSNHFVRYALAPWNDALAGPEEELAFARHYFVKVHGERAKSWVLRVSDGMRGAPRVASAIDAALLEAIRGCFAKSGRARLASVQPYLMAAFNQRGGAVPPAGAWLLIVEAERACLALCAKGRWQALASAKGSFSAPEEWAALLDRERLRVADGDAVSTVLVHAAHDGGARWPQIGDWKFEPLAAPALGGYLPLEDGRYAMALAGAPA